MNLQDVARQRLANQQVGRSQLSSPKDLLGWMGALQAQDYEMAKWALAIRLPGCTLKEIEVAIESGEIIRTHVLRPTWHFVAAENLRWMLKLTRPRIMAAVKSRHNYLGLTEKAIARSNSLIAEALSGGKQLIRKKLVEILEDAGFENSDNRASHLLLRAELDGVICSGASKGKDYTFALLDERVPEAPKLDKEEALAKLAGIYFRSHGPATLEDFAWWSGLTMTDARKVLDMIRDDFNSVGIDSQTYWFAETPPIRDISSVHLLPGYDEFIISYKERSAVIADEHHRKAISSNGIFWPAIVHNGQVIGIWKRTVRKETVVVETEYFRKPTKQIRSLVEEAAGRFGIFLGRECDLNHNLN